MNLIHLKAFDAIARAKSVSRAAADLHTSQPALSKQLRLLEQALGVVLVGRLPRGVRLTEAGELVATYARRIFTLAEEAERQVGELQGLRRGRLALGASTTIGVYYLPALLATFRTRYPQIVLSVEIYNTQAIHEHVAAGALDLGLTEGLIHDERLFADVFMVDQLVPILPPKHALARQVSATLARFCEEPMLVREPGSGTRDVVAAALRRHGVEAEPVLSLGSTEAIKRAVAAGMGVAILSKLAVEDELRAGALKTLKLLGVTLERPFHVVLSRDHLPTQAMQAFLEMLPRGQRA